MYALGSIIDSGHNADIHLTTGAFHASRLKHP